MAVRHVPCAMFRACVALLEVKVNCPGLIGGSPAQTAAQREQGSAQPRHFYAFLSDNFVAVARNRYRCRPRPF